MHLRAGIQKSPKIQTHSGLPRIHGFDGMTNFKSGYNAGVSFFKKSLAILCTQGQGHTHTHTIWVHSFTFCSPDFLRKTGRGRLVTREAQRTVSLSTLLYFGSFPVAQATLRLRVLGEQTLSVCWVRLSSL